MQSFIWEGVPGGVNRGVGKWGREGRNLGSDEELTTVGSWVQSWGDLWESGQNSP